MTTVPLRQINCGSYVIDESRGDPVKVDPETVARWIRTERAWLAMQREMSATLDEQNAWTSLKGETRIEPPAEDHALFEDDLDTYDTPTD